MIRVLHFNNTIYRYDVVDAILTHMDRSEFEISALTSKLPPKKIPYAPHEAYPIRCLNYEFSSRTYYRMIPDLTREIRRFKPDILHAHGFDENIVASIAVRLARVPCYIIGRHYSDHIYFLTRGIKRRFYLALEGFCNHTAQRISVPSKQVLNILLQQKVPSEKIVLLPFGLDFSKYHTSSPEAPMRLRREYGLENSYVILTCCRLNPEKGLEYLLGALPALRPLNKDMRLVMIGQGSREVQLRELCRELQVDDLVQFMGWRDDAMDWIAAADVLIQPSFCESFCQSMVEGLAFGKPVIITPVGAAPDIIGNNERGRLIPKADTGAIIASLSELMENRALAKKLGELGQEYIYRNMGADAAADRFEHFYKEALAATHL